MVICSQWRPVVAVVMVLHIAVIALPAFLVLLVRRLAFPFLLLTSQRNDPIFYVGDFVIDREKDFIAIGGGEICSPPSNSSVSPPYCQQWDPSTRQVRPVFLFSFLSSTIDFEITLLTS